MAERILIIDDDRKLTGLLFDYLSNYDFKVLIANTPREGLGVLRREHPALIVLDLMLPETDGFSLDNPKHPRFLKTVRGTGYLFLTSEGKE